MNNYRQKGLLISCAITLFLSCKNSKEDQSIETVGLMDLKRGEVVSCGPQDGQFGKTSFMANIPEKLRPDFNTGIALLHSFEYDEAEKKFAKIIDQEPDCAMAYWGVAMTNFHPLGHHPTPPELEKGLKAVEIARSIKNKTKRESDYIEAIARFMTNCGSSWITVARVLNFEKAMEEIYIKLS